MKLGSPSFQLTIRLSTPEICQRCLFLRGLLMLKKPPSFASAPRCYSCNLRFLRGPPSGRRLNLSALIRASVCTLWEIPLPRTPDFHREGVVHLNSIQHTLRRLRSREILAS